MSGLSNSTRRLMRVRELVIDKGDGDVVPGEFAARLREPVDAEAAILADLAKNGASDEDLDAVAGAIRLLDSAGADLDVFAKEAKPVTGTPLDEQGPIPPWFAVEIENARQKDPNLRNLSDESIMTRLIGEHPEWAADDAPSARDAWDAYSEQVKKEKPRSPEERARIAREAREFNEGVQRELRKAEKQRAEKERRASRSMEETMTEFDTVMKSIEILEDEKALQRIDEAALKIRKSDPSLSKSQAGWKACVDNPELYASYQRHEGRQQGWLNDSPETIKKAADTEALLAEAARPYLAADPSLSHSQAVAKALEADRSLYERTI